MQTALPFPELLEGVATLLDGHGVFATVVPTQEEAFFLGLAERQGLFPKRILHVKGNPKAPTKRSFLEFTKEKAIPVEEALVIERKRHAYTEAYRALTKDFYLKM